MCLPSSEPEVKRSILGAKSHLEKLGIRKSKRLAQGSWQRKELGLRPVPPKPHSWLDLTASPIWAAWGVSTCLSF